MNKGGLNDSELGYLLIPPVSAVISLLYLLSKITLSRSRKGKRVLGSVSGEDPLILADEHLPATKNDVETQINTFDGLAILLFRLTRLAGCFGLLILQAIDQSNGQLSRNGLLFLVFYVYLSILGVLSAVSSTMKWRDASSRQLALLLMIDFSVYFILDAWPYATDHKQPFDPPADPITWVRMATLCVSAVVIPLIMPRPFRPTNQEELPSLQETVSLLSRVTFAYVDKLVFYAYRAAHITIDDLPHLPESVKASTLSERAFKHLDPLLQKKKRYIVWGMLRTFAKEYIALFSWISLNAITIFAGPYGMKNVLAYLETGHSPLGVDPWFWILILAFGPVFSGVIANQYFYVGTRVMIETESIMTQLVFEHSLRIQLRGDTLGDKDHVPEGHAKDKKEHFLVGKINNLVTTDLVEVSYAHNILNIPAAAIQITTAVIFLYNLLGWSALIGLAVLITSIPILTRVGKLIMIVQRNKMNLTDRRVQAVSESLSVLRMVKLFAWEPHVLKKLFALREDEMKQIRNKRLLTCAVTSISGVFPLLAKLATFAVYTLYMNKQLTASVIFSALMVFEIVQNQLNVLMRGFRNLLDAKISYDRIDEFINSTELLPNLKAVDQRIFTDAPKQDEIGFNACTFSWDAFEDDMLSPPQSNKRRPFYLTCDGRVAFRCGHVNLIVGPTASVKTSVLMALLGEMHYKPHGIDSWYNLPRDQGVAYAAQESWVLNDTIRNNVLFGQKYDDERYKKVLMQCALDRDIREWEAGDLTEVGEKGLTLSGGQKARVTLARAIYSPASVILLDDVLSALDVHTAKWIANKALQGDIIRGRTVLLVTHNIALASPIAEHVVLLSRNGKIIAQGSVSSVLESNVTLRKQIEKEQETPNTDSASSEPEAEERQERKKKKPTTDNTKEGTSGKLVVAEEKAMGRVEWEAVLLFLRGLGQPSLLFLWVVTICVSVLADIFQTWFVGYWSSQYRRYPTLDFPALRYFLLYALITFCTLVFDTIRRVFWVIRSTRASKVIYYQLLHSIYKAPFRWLDVTPVGRIITRCTQDIGAIDGNFSEMFSSFTYLTISVVALFISTVTMAGWFALLPGITVSGLGGFLGLLYLRAQLSVRRELSNAKAPIMSQLGTAIVGLQSIRAYGAQSLFRVELKKRVDVYMRAAVAFYDMNRWIAARADFLGGAFTAVVSSFLVYGVAATAGRAGFTLSIVLTFAKQILVWVRTYNTIEVNSNSLERILDFMRMDHELPSTDRGKPPAYWPSSGSLRVESLSARYSDDSPEALKDITFEVKSGERIGIVGRTGAGKSTIALALLRAIKTTGKVYYDDIATDELNLDTLRSAITLIPQQPELIRGTLRENLDPFEEHSDSFLNDALRAAGLHDAHDAVAPQGANGEEGGETRPKIGLDTEIESGGTNFSLGQRQIIALARALVRRSKLLILDEATAAIDYSNDMAIQQTLRTEFDKETTLITIAHRLQTIMDYDKIMVMDAGQITEFDTPANLLQDTSSAFYALVDEGDGRESLRAMVIM